MTATTIPARRSGARHWIGSFGQLTRWQILRLRRLLPISIVIQLFSSTGIVIGMGLLYGELPAERVLYLTTGAVTISLIVVGLVMGPQIIAQERMSGSAEFMAALPVPRSATTMGWMVLNLAVTIPGIVAAVAAARWYHGVAVDLTWLIVPGGILVVFGATMVGVAYGNAIPNPRAVGPVSQVVVFLIFGFSPIAYPADQLPDWLASIHRWLPFESMGTAIRAGLAPDLAEDVGRAFVVLGVWTAIGVAIASWSLGRRP